MSENNKKVYLGDSVYACLERGMICLTTENGYGPSNTIYLEPEVYQALTRYVDRLLKKPEVKIEPPSEDMV